VEPKRCRSAVWVATERKVRSKRRASRETM
jgi:hypothetical protein